MGIPANWTGTPDATDGIVNWISNDPSDDITGPALAGFSFFSPVGPGTVPLDLQFEDSSGNTLFTLNSSTTGPSATPEPGTFLLVPCLAALLWLGRRRGVLTALASVACLSAGQRPGERRSFLGAGYLDPCCPAGPIRRLRLDWLGAIAVDRPLRPA